MTETSAMHEVDLLDWATRQGGGVLVETKLTLGLDADDAPFDVPLHDLDFRPTTFTLGPDTASFWAVKSPVAAVGRDAEGRLFLVRRGDWLLRDVRGNYSLLKGE